MSKAKAVKVAVADREESVAPSLDEGERPAEPLNEQEVADLAYRRWVERGCPQGSPDEDWFEAERELRAGGNGS